MSEAQWHLLKASDKQVHGPTDLAQLRSWASEAKISPMDRLSSDDQQSWVRAPMVPELQMDWLIEMPDSYLYGPTSLGTIQEFLATGEIDENVLVINCREGTEYRLAELPAFQASPHRTRSAETTFVGTQWPDAAKGESDAALHQRIAWLEKQVMDLQRAIGNWEAGYKSLRQQFIEATGREPV